VDVIRRIRVLRFSIRLRVRVSIRVRVCDKVRIDIRNLHV